MDGSLMGNLTLNGSSSGSVTISPPAVAGTTTITIPATSGTMLVGSGGALSVSQGGTGVATLTANAVVLGNGTGAVTSVSPGTSGNVLTSNGTTWISQAASSSGVTSISAGTGITVSGSTGAVTVNVSTSTGGVGTYAMLGYETPSDRSPGYQSAASNLYWASASGYIGASVHPSGTWQLLGYLQGGLCVITQANTSIWQRIA